jgi:hypothetical protein
MKKVYQVKIRVSFVEELLVAANSEEEAMEYVKNTDDWKELGQFEQIHSRASIVPEAVHQLEHPSQTKYDGTTNLVGPDSGDEEFTVAELFFGIGWEPDNLSDDASDDEREKAYTEHAEKRRELERRFNQEKRRGENAEYSQTKNIE